MDSNIAVGTWFENREAVRAAGLHKHPMAGIGYEPGGNAESIVISGGYKDDVDEGNRIIYTGQGGQSKAGSKIQVEDQKVEKGNRALVNSALNQSPVRVIRGHGGDPEHSPKTGYRFDGYFLVTNHWFEKSQDGPLVIRFELQKIDEVSSYETAVITQTENWLKDAPGGIENPLRVLTKPMARIKRNPQIAKWVKSLYEDQCQICRITLRTPSSNFSQGAHIRGLGQPHNGADSTTNMLCLCANCHILFDFGTFYVDSQTMQVHNTVDGTICDLLINTKHNLDKDALDYHKLHYAGIR